ncbi:unnamed protein product [Didymodactylos carnosus]|uniref:Uncharacterized protein n=1 Tax=Didymodactylos carnosus TaxID=1234261 RepID=A0A814TWT5_9BILA|nr:unnamed protein product [Didymodactylos carnosus]CAF1167870.1 unnamed protein product [Didymodactylos carnosus]CAF3757088.1 unnamed protein product [Didymodactylos carnosus]CAF3931503.1 unnamed protein product [Didymodactylos carnosus]
MNDELIKIKENYKQEQDKIEMKYKNHLNSMNQAWMILQQQNKTQSENLMTMNAAISQSVFPMCQNIVTAVFSVANKLKNILKTDEFDDLIVNLSTEISYLKETQQSYSNHQSSLLQLTNKQNEILNLALDSLLLNTNGLQ